jgi:hypothetical protein
MGRGRGIRETGRVNVKKTAQLTSVGDLRVKSGSTAIARAGGVVPQTKSFARCRLGGKSSESSK